MYKVALALSLLILAACATETEPLSDTPVRASPQPASSGLQDGLAVRYYYSSFNHIRDLQGFMRPRMLKVFPQLDDVKLDYCWGGYIGITVNRIPDIGRLSDTVYYAHGYSGQGVALTGIYGKVIAEAVAGQAERFDVLAQFKHTPFPGGPIRTPMLVAAMLYYRMRDLLG